MDFVGNLLLLTAVKEFWKSVKNWQVIAISVVLLFGTQCRKTEHKFTIKDNITKQHVPDSSKKSVTVITVSLATIYYCTADHCLPNEMIRKQYNVHSVSYKTDISQQ